ncbi:Putative uncharacterized protein [Taphrina deformans PYCC 5710]|uniref:Calcipressin family protein n=1 Tax=Taphrina deformans (strain PYCC 5710 / ATCC 11124 / CBS 356.35 / IMI 108563 / JCM 9778 / NBRC 8474) TaxID=1097556 RepID=R4X6B9_TAPDE|nr:Putative uncharacterized protein [Taphrina deformans PYCC 5710]|eukprot:CCG80589.1 Putative uncharacterized protein [Taphrina deformans PYCC 5710]
MTVSLPPGLCDAGQTEQDVVTSLHDIKEPTNPTDTLIITNLPSETFQSENIKKFRQEVAQIGSVVKWIPLKSFIRVIASFRTTEDAIHVRHALHKTLAGGSVVYVYYAESLSAKLDTSGLLQVPELERNWLISPPGSPPVGWTQVREDAPNAQILHESLLAALERLPQEFEESCMNHDNTTDSGNDPSKAQKPDRLTILDSTSSELPAIVVHLDNANSDDIASSNGTTGISRTRVSMVKTPMPGH